MYQTKVRIQAIDRLPNSYSGNPRFTLAYEPADGGSIQTINTAADASYNYEIGNLGLGVGDWVTIGINGRGTVDSIRPA